MNRPHQLVIEVYDSLGSKLPFYFIDEFLWEPKSGDILPAISNRQWKELEGADPSFILKYEVTSTQTFPYLKALDILSAQHLPKKCECCAVSDYVNFNEEQITEAVRKVKEVTVNGAKVLAEKINNTKVPGGRLAEKASAPANFHRKELAIIESVDLNLVPTRSAVYLRLDVKYESQRSQVITLTLCRAGKFDFNIVTGLCQTFKVDGLYELEGKVFWAIGEGGGDQFTPYFMRPLDLCSPDAEPFQVNHF